MLLRCAVVCLLVQGMHSLMRELQVGLCVAAMVSCGIMAGYRSGQVVCLLIGSWSSIVPTFCCTDDLQDTRYFMELICSVPAKPLPMQILALANNAGKANQVSSCKLAVADSYGSKAHKLWTCGARV